MHNYSLGLTGDRELDDDLTALGLPWDRKRGCYTLGRVAGSRLTLIAGMFPAKSHLALRLKRIAAHLRSHSDPSAIAMDTSKAAYGLVTHHPLYALMISDGLFPGELPGDPVRALLLVVTLLPDGDSKISKSATRAWHARVKRRDREDGDELEAAIRALLHAPGRSHLDLAIAASQKHPAGYDPDVLRILLGRAHALLIDDRGKSPPESGTRIAIEVAPTPEDCTFIVTQKTASEEEGGGETVMVLPSLAAARFGKRVARLQAVQERDFRTRSLVPGSSASLHGDELDEVLQSLDQALGDDESTSKAFSGNLVAALVTLTTLPRSSIWRGLAELQQGVIPQWLHQAEDGSWSLVVVAIDINSRRSQPAENLISGRSPEAQLLARVEN